MSNCRVERRIRSMFAAMFLVGSVFLISPTAVEGSDPNLEGCPSATYGEDYGVDHWEETYRDRGVTLCAGIAPELSVVNVNLQIVDLNAGAKIHIVSETAAGSGECYPGTLFNKKTAEDWFDAIPNLGFAEPSENLFSTTNAGFFISTEGSDTTALSLPESRFDTCRSKGWALATQYENPPDPAWDAAKLRLWFGSYYTQGYQSAGIQQFSGHYTDYDAGLYNAYQQDQLVAFNPMEGDLDQHSPRTFVGVRANKVYIISIAAYLTLGEVGYLTGGELGLSDLYYQIIQLDGGGSTQTFNVIGDNIESSVPWISGRPSNCAGGPRRLAGRRAAHLRDLLTAQRPRPAGIRGAGPTPQPRWT